ncbi:MAG: carbohydrate-binding domain-containing protein [Lachnospiraceae bacterium]|nr:carbohydrate-binding domain-containing protein [Lachnospiraceae bacterium]
MRIKKILLGCAFLLGAPGILCGCDDFKKEKDDGENYEKDYLDESEAENDEEQEAVTETDFSDTDEDMFSNRDFKSEYDESESIRITLSNNTAICDSKNVLVEGSNITIIDEGTYILSGELEDGMIIVNAEDTDKLQIVLEGVSINSESSAPIYILGGDKVFITLASETKNYLSNGGSFEAIDENNIDGVIFSKQDLTFNGTGSLTIDSPSGHGVVCKDDLVFTGGNISITASGHGLDVNDSVRTAGGRINIVSGKDGIHVDNSDDATLGYVYISSGDFDITSEGDGISAVAYVQITDGDFNIITGGGSVNGEKESSDSWGNYMGDGGHHGGGYPGGPGMGDTPHMQDMVTEEESDDSSTSIKGIKVSGSLMIEGGSFSIDSADDAIHSNLSITIKGGAFDISTGDDGFHADEILDILGGDINISASYEGLEALNVDISSGNISLISSDDGINAAGGTDNSGFGGPRQGDMFGGSSNGSVEISGGSIYINASGDGIDANGYIEITDGYIVVCGPTVGDTATLDYDTTATISGGTFIGTGASGMAQTFSESEQGVYAVSVGNVSAGTNIVLEDMEGNTILEYTPELDFSVVILSSPDINKAETYKITVGDVSGEFESY